MRYLKSACRVIKETRIVFAFFFNFLAFSVFSQSLAPHIDSLNTELRKLLKTDVNAAGELIDSILGISMIENWKPGIIVGKLQKAKFHKKKGDYELAKREHENNISFIESSLSEIPTAFQELVWRSYGVSYYELAVLSYLKGDYDKSLRNTIVSDSIQDVFFLGKDYGQTLYKNSKLTLKMLRANIYYVRGEIERAIPIFKEAAVLNIEYKNYFNAAVAYLNIGTLNRDKGNLLAAIKSLEKARKLAIDNDYISLEASIIGIIGQIFYAMHSYEEALKYAQEALLIHEKKGSKFDIAFTSSDVADYLKKLGRMDSAMLYYSRSLNIHKEIQNTDDVVYVLERIASLKAETGKCNEAQFYINEGLQIVREHNLPDERLFLRISKAECELQLGNLNNAKREVEELLALAIKTENINHKKDVFRVAHKVFFYAKEYKKAYEYYDAFLVYRDSIYTEDIAMEVARTEYNYALENETARLENERIKQELIFNQQLDKERWIKISAIVVALFVAVIALITYSRYEIKRLANEQLIEKNQKLRSLRKREQELSEETISSKERELATMAMASLEKNSLLKDLQQKVSFIESRMGSELKPSLKEMQKTIAGSMDLDKSWDSFMHRFEDVHPRFFDKLKQDNPKLTINDLKLSAYVKIGMSNKEIANVSHITLGSVKSKINRLKKKLDLGADDRVRDYMLKYA